MRPLLLLLSLIVSLAANAQQVEPSASLRLSGYSAPTPESIPGARVIGTAELRHAVQGPPGERPFLFDVRGEKRESLPGAIWLPGAGRGSSFEDPVQKLLAATLREVTRGDASRMLVFFCAGPRCWLSYNAALRAVKLGYRNVRWYREGIEVWGEGGGALAEPVLAWRNPPK